MKKVAICAVLVLLLGLCSAVFAENGVQNQVAVSEAIAKNIATILNANSVLGQPLDYQGNTIIPVVTIGFGFGSGSGEHKDGGLASDGAGGGGGGVVVPISFLVITKEGKVEIIDAQKSQFAEILKGVADSVIKLISNREELKDEGDKKHDNPQ